MLKNSEDAHQLEMAINRLPQISKMEDRLAVLQYLEPPYDQICGQYSQENFERLQDQINAMLRAKAHHTQAQTGHALKDHVHPAVRARQACHAHVGSFGQAQDSDSDQGTDSDDSESNYPDIIESGPAADYRDQNPVLRAQNPNIGAQNADLATQIRDLAFAEDSKVNDDQETFGRNVKNKTENCELLMVTNGTSKPKIRFYTNIFAKDKMGIPKSDISPIFPTGDSSDEEGFSDSDDEEETNFEVSGRNYPVNPVVIELSPDLEVQNPDLGDQNPELGDQNPDSPDVETNDDQEAVGSGGVEDSYKRLLDLYQQSMRIEGMRDQNLDVEDQNLDVEDQNPDLPDLETNNDHETFGVDDEGVTNNDEFDPYHQSQIFERMRGQNPVGQDQYVDLPDLDENYETNDDHETFGNAGEDETNGEFDPFHQSQLFEIERQNRDLIQEDSEANVDYALEIERQLPDDLLFIHNSETNDDHETFGNADVDDTNADFEPPNPDFEP